MLLLIYSVTFCALWMVIIIYMNRSLAGMPSLHREMMKLSCDGIEWPVLTVIIPACNEARHIGPALKSLLAQDYPKLEIVVINDRSTDDTGEILEHLAEYDARIKVIHISELPSGWLGKVHAMYQGVKQASGDWYLFTDADVYFGTGTLQQTLCYAIQNRLNHLTCLPEVRVSDFWLDVAVRSFFLIFCLTARIAEVNRKNSKHPIGIGAFNLVQAGTFHKTPGFKWLRMETVDDYGLGIMIKQAGGSTRLVNALEDISVPWYEDLAAMIKGLEKNSFGPGANYSLTRLFLIEVFLFGLVAAPFFSLVAGIMLDDLVLLVTAGLVIVTLLIFALFSPKQDKSDVISYLFFPAGMIMIGLMMLRSAWICIRQNGIDWRGTHYSIEELRRGQRVKFF